MNGKDWTIHNRSGSMRVLVTRELPGRQWLETLIAAGCRVDTGAPAANPSREQIEEAIGDACDGAIGQLTEPWGEELFSALKAAGGRAYSNYAVGYNNVDLEAATRMGIPVGNTPGVLTETTAEMAVALTFAAARRIAEADAFMRAGRFTSWHPALFLGELLWRKTLGVVGAGRIGSAYARMMVEGHRMDLVYYDLHKNESLEDYLASYGRFLSSRGEKPVSCRRAEDLEEVLRVADVVSLHTVLDETTTHLINPERLALMKENAVLVNTSRGPILDEAALVAHCREHPEFRAGLDVFEDEPAMSPGLVDLPNVVVVPHIGSATRWTREGMAALAAANVAAILMGYPVWADPDISPFLRPDPPRAAPSILNARELNLPFYRPAAKAPCPGL
ncbi:MAG: D-glycerate dehydrogenase [Deltaproteobacteria bacterium]|nr:D-glycerate dehydrogenase [Deltaproteobacteria bacterium]